MSQMFQYEIWPTSGRRHGVHRRRTRQKEKKRNAHSKIFPFRLYFSVTVTINKNVNSVQCIYVRPYENRLSMFLERLQICMILRHGGLFCCV